MIRSALSKRAHRRRASTLSSHLALAHGQAVTRLALETLEAIHGRAHDEDSSHRHVRLPAR